jgi:transposase
MWGGEAPRRIFAYTQPTDMRKSFQGLLALVQRVFTEDPYLCVEREYVAASHKHAAKRLTAWRFACSRHHIRSRDNQAD